MSCGSDSSKVSEQNIPWSTEGKKLITHCILGNYCSRSKDTKMHKVVTLQNDEKADAKKILRLEAGTDKMFRLEEGTKRYLDIWYKINILQHFIKKSKYSQHLGLHQSFFIF